MGIDILGVKLTGQPVLKDIRILDFTWVLAGPYATRLLADFGAEVIKVQPLLPAEADDEFTREYYNNWNRNKRGITLNLSRPEGVSLVKKLATISDVVIDNFTPRVMANWGLDYENLRQVKPDIITLSMSVMGQTGPWCDYTGFGPTVQALSGITWLTSFPGKAPLGPGFSYADHVAGLYAAAALLGALEYRRRTGEGQHIDISQVEAMTSLLGGAVMASAGGRDVRPYGNDSPLAAPHNVYRCAGENRWIAIAVRTEEAWLGFRRALGDPPWAGDEKFTTLAGRLDNNEEMDRLIERWTVEHTAEEAMTLLQRNGVAAGVVHNAADLAGNPHLLARGFFIGIQHRDSGETMTDATPIKLSETPADYRRPAPVPGEDNDYVYRELLGMNAGEIASLTENGVI